MVGNISILLAFFFFFFCFLAIKEILILLSWYGKNNNSPLKTPIQIRWCLSYQEVVKRLMSLCQREQYSFVALSQVFPSGQAVQTAHVLWKVWLSSMIFISSATSKKTLMIHRRPLPASKTHHTQCISKSRSLELYKDLFMSCNH